VGVRRGNENVCASPRDAADTSALKERVRRIADVVRVLRGRDLSERVRAARVLQAAVRGFLVRLRLHHRSARYRVWRERQLTARAAQRWRATAASVVPAAVAAASSSTANKVTPALGDTTLGARVTVLEEVVKLLWADAESSRPVLRCIRSRAARTIQACYRGFVARRHYASVRREYRRFADKFRPAVVAIQTVARAALASRAVAAAAARAGRVGQLEADLRDLRAQLSDLARSFVLLSARLNEQQYQQQQRLISDNERDGQSTGLTQGRSAAADQQDQQAQAMCLEASPGVFTPSPSSIRRWTRGADASVVSPSTYSDGL
jgi:hypothetical protein